VGAAAGVRSAAIYSVGQRLGQLPVKIVTPRAVLLFTQAGALTARGDHEGLAQAVKHITRTVQAIAIPAALILGFLAGPTIRAWVGPEYHKAAIVIGLLCLAGCVQSWAFTLTVALSGGGQPQLASVLLAIEAVFHVALGIVLADKYGAVGMAVAVLISVVVMEGTLLLPIAYRRLRISIGDATVSAIRALALPALVVGGIGWAVAGGNGFLGNFAVTHSKVASLAAVAGVGLWLLVVFACLFFLTGLRPAERDRVTLWMRSKFGRSTTS
jgi:O-antigen/teichoic acid export membrane protein